MVVVLGVDRSTPPTSAELAMFKLWGVAWVGGYHGGVNNGGRSWQPKHIQLVRNNGQLFKPIYVGQNICPGCGTPNFTASQGQSDAADCLRTREAYGITEPCECFDLEYDAWWHGPKDGVLSYASAFVATIAAQGINPDWYGPDGMVQAWRPPVPTTFWLAKWDGIGNLATFPNAGAYRGIGIQFSDQWHGWDASHSDLTPWNGVNPMPDTLTDFPTGMIIGGGFAQYWQHHGGIYAFGLPISNEYDDTDEGGPVRYQWFEHTIFEYRVGQNPDNWDVTVNLLAELAYNDPDKLARLQASAQAHTANFWHP